MKRLLRAHPWRIVNYLLAAAALAYVIYQLHLNTLGRQLAGLVWWMVAVAIVLDVISVALQAVRWRFLLRPTSPPFGARREWPVLFVASSMTGAASLLDILDLSRREHRVVRTFGLLGKAAEAVSARCVERRIAQVPATAHPFRRGRASLLWRAAQLLGIASLVTALLPRQTRKKRIASAVMGTASSLCVRFASLEIGMASSQNPCAAFGQQRSGYGAFEKTRIAAVVGAGEERACRASDSRMAERIR
jgi:hypothetical protein